MNFATKSAFKLLGIPQPVTLYRKYSAIDNELGADDCLLIGSDDCAIYCGLADNLAANCNLSLATAWPDAVYDAIVFSVAHLSSVQELEALPKLLQGALKNLRPGGKLLLVGADNHTTTAAHKVLLAAVYAFVRSLAKELGSKGICVNLVWFKNGANCPDIGAILFLLSPRSAYVNAQLLMVDCKATAANLSSNILAHKTVLVTGAKRGIGLAIAKYVKREGGNLIAIDYGAGEFAQQMNQLEAVAINCDLTQEDAAKQICDQLAGTSIDALVHNAGITRDKTFRYMSFSNWQQVLNTNFIAASKLTTALLNRELLSPVAHVVGISSIAAIAGNRGQCNYAASKAALGAYINSLSEQNSHYNLHANSIAPGFIETAMTAKLPFAVKNIGRVINSLRQSGKPEDVAELAVFLCSDNSRGINGQTIRICGQNILGK